MNNEFKIRVKLDPRPQYKLAWMAGVNPTVLSQIITGYVRPKRNDPRVVKVGKALGLSPDECFEADRIS